MYPVEKREEGVTWEACKIPSFLTNFDSDLVENSPIVNLGFVQKDFHILVLNKYLREFSKYLES